MVSPLAQHTARLVGDHSQQCPPCIAGAFKVAAWGAGVLGLGAATSACSDADFDGKVTPPGPHNPIDLDATSNPGNSAIPTLPDTYVSDTSATTDGETTTEVADPGITPEADSPFFFAPSTFALSDCQEITALETSKNHSHVIAACFDSASTNSSFWQIDPTTPETAPVNISDIPSAKLHAFVPNNAQQIFASATDYLGTDLTDTVSGLGQIHLANTDAFFIPPLPWTSADGTVYDYLSDAPQGEVMRPTKTGGISIVDGKVWITAPGEFKRCITLSDGQQQCEPANHTGFTYTIDIFNKDGNGISAIPMPRLRPTGVARLGDNGNASVVVASVGARTGFDDIPGLTHGALQFINPSSSTLSDTHVIIPAGSGTQSSLSTALTHVALGSDHSAVYYVDTTQNITAEFAQQQDPLYVKTQTSIVSDTHLVSDVAFADQGSTLIAADSTHGALHGWLVADKTIVDAATIGTIQELGNNTDTPSTIKLAVLSQDNGTDIVCASFHASVQCFGIHRAALAGE